MKDFFSKILDQPTQQPIFKFVPQIKISPKSTLHLQIQPNDPHTASNIVINAYVSKTNRTIVPIKVQWSRYKFKSDQQYSIEKIQSVIGNTYMCQPSDLGSTIQATIKCLDQSIGGQGQASIGPIRIDAMLKRLIDGALYNQSLLSQIIIVQGEQKLNTNLRLGFKTMEFEQINTNEKLTMNYSFSQPKIQLSPKDPCKIYLRFQQDKQNVVRSWLDKLIGSEKNKIQNLNQSSISMKIPHSNVSAVSSKTKLFQKLHTHCINKLQVRFLSRNSRDLFLFTLRAFICKQDMKNSILMQRIESLQALKNQQDYTKFLQYMSLKSEIIRLAQMAKQLQIDRDNKIKDINNMQESISQMTLTYLKIIQQKSQNQHVDLQQSYSMISMKRQQILGRKQFRQLKNENQLLKNQIRDLNQQLELQRFFKKDENNESMMFNRTTNPFMKKNAVNLSNIIDQNQSGTYNLVVQNKLNESIHKNILEISKSYIKVLQQNKKLKQKSAQHRNLNNQSRDIENLLQSLHQNEQTQKRIGKLQNAVENYKKEILKLKQLTKSLQFQNCHLKQKLNQRIPSQINSPNQNHQINTMNVSASYRPGIQNSYYSRTSAQNQSMMSNSYMSMNQSMTSQAELIQLQKKLIQLSNLNTKFESQNMRLRKQRDYYRSLYDSQILKGKNSNLKITVNQQANRENNNQFAHSTPKNTGKYRLDDSHIISGPDQQNSTIIRLKQQKQKLQNEKNSLLKKIDSLTRQSNALIKPDANLQKKFQQIRRQNQKLMQQNQNLQKTIQNMKNFHDLQKKQMLPNKSNQSLSLSLNNQPKDQEILKLKKVNANLLQQIKQLRIQIERKNDSNLDNSRVIQLQNQLDIFKTYARGSSLKPDNIPSKDKEDINLRNQDLLKQISQLKKENQRLKQQISNYQLKVKTQTNTIQKLMNQLDQLNRSQIISQHQNSFSKKYLHSPDKNSLEENQKYRKKIVELQAQLNLLRKNTQAVNRSRDLSMSMMGYDQERIQIYKKQNQSLMLENQNLSSMCSKYAKDARQANIEVNKLRQKIMQMNKERLLIPSDL